MKSIKKSTTTKAAQDYEFTNEDATIMNPNQRPRWEGDKAFKVVLGKHLVWRHDYELVVSRFKEMYDTLIDGVEYLPEDLVCGDQICDPWGVPVGELDTLLCLKHLAAKSKSGIVEVQWDTFMLAA